MQTNSTPASRRLAIHDGANPVPTGMRGAVLAIGNFDGVHRGHQALLQSAMDIAAKNKVPAGAMVFEPHPRVFFRPDLPHFTLTPRPRQLELFEAFGLDLTVLLPFDKALSQLSAREFIEDILIGRLGVGHVVIGYDFSFGRERAGTPDTMREMGSSFGFGVTVIPPIGNGGAVFSSSAIRGLLAQGDVAGANLALGHRWRVTGPVTGGAKRGTGMGFPTANVTMPAGTNLGHGIYAAWVHVDGERHGGAAYLGTRPQFDNGAPVLETFLLEFDGNLYGREIGVAFVDFLRRDGAFEGIEALKLQMAKDCARAAEVLAAVDARDPLTGFLLGRA